MTMPTTKVCPNCGDTAMIPFNSTDTKRCASCNTLVEWPLEPGQRRTFDNTRKKPLDKEEQ